MSPDIQELIAELEEAERAATRAPWDNLNGTIRAIVSEDLACPLFTSRTPVELGTGRSFDKRYADAWRQEHENARLIALMRTHLPVLLEAVKRQGEALEWQPIETAPKDGTRIILAWGGATVVGYYLDNSKTSHPWQGWQVPSMEPTPRGLVTHWRPLPSPPKEPDHE